MALLLNATGPWHARAVLRVNMQCSSSHQAYGFCGA